MQGAKRSTPSTWNCRDSETEAVAWLAKNLDYTHCPASGQAMIAEEDAAHRIERPVPRRPKLLIELDWPQRAHYPHSPYSHGILLRHNFVRQFTSDHFAEIVAFSPCLDHRVPRTVVFRYDRCRFGIGLIKRRPVRE